jgi:hypothetical protein
MGEASMTEAEWLACNDPAAMLGFLRGKASGRKLRLFACACCRRIWDLLDERGQVLVEQGERLADGARRATAAAGAATPPLRLKKDIHSPRYLAWLAATCTIVSDVWVAARAARSHAAGGRPQFRDAEPREQAALLREIFGNPFRPAALDPAWLTADVASLAQAAYVERELPGGRLDPGRLAVLSDALEDAGCVNDDVLSHLRSPGLHVRGCWALDLILGKQ